jgi:hypothetical protein
MSVDASVVSSAIVAWSGFGETAWPARDDARVVDALGPDVASEVMPAVRELEDEFYASDARHVATDLSAMAERSSADFASKHPEISSEAVRALAWCYTYDYK